MKNKAVKTYLDSIAYNKLAQEARLRNKSLSETIQSCLQEYLDLRREMASAFEVPGKIGEEHTGKVIHTLLGRTELRVEELIRGLEAKLNSLSTQLDYNTTNIEKIILLIHGKMQSKTDPGALHSGEQNTVGIKKH